MIDSIDATRFNNPFTAKLLNEPRPTMTNMSLWIHMAGDKGAMDAKTVTKSSLLQHAIVNTELISSVMSDEGASLRMSVGPNYLDDDSTSNVAVIDDRLRIIADRRHPAADRGLPTANTRMLLGKLDGHSALALHGFHLIDFARLANAHRKNPERNQRLNEWIRAARMSVYNSAINLGKILGVEQVVVFYSPSVAATDELDVASKLTQGIFDQQTRNQVENSFPFAAFKQLYNTQYDMFPESGTVTATYTLAR